jgi:hypothetical protein
MKGEATSSTGLRKVFIPTSTEYFRGRIQPPKFPNPNFMKSILTLSLLFLICSCVSTKVASPAVGTWDYSITGTPEGDFAGDFIVSVTEGKYSALLKSKVGEIFLSNPIYDKSTKKLTGTFDYQGTTIFFESITTGDTMTGSISAGGSSFPFKATKKK